MQTKFYFLLVALVGFSSVSSSVIAQSACFDYNDGPADYAGYQLFVEPYMSHGAEALEGLAGQTTYRIYLETPSSGDYVNLVHNEGAGLTLATTTSFFQHPFGDLTPNQMNTGYFEFFPELEFDSYLTIGLTEEPGYAEGEVEVFEDDWSDNFEAGNSIDLEGAPSEYDVAGWYADVEVASNASGGDDNRVLLAQLTTDGDLSIALNVTLEDSSSGMIFQHQFTAEYGFCGCTDPGADNYEEGSDFDDGSCIYIGCTDATACNFYAAANSDDGTCEYCCTQGTSTDSSYGVDIEVHTASGILGMTTYRMYATMENPGDALSAVAGDASNVLLVSAAEGFYQDANGSATANTMNPLFFSIFPELEFDSYVSVGLTSAPGDGENAIQLAESPSSPWIDNFEAGGDIVIDNEYGGAWFVSPGGSNAIAGDDLRVLIGQFTTSGALSGSALIQVFIDGDQTNEVQFYATFSTPDCGCQDESACNYDADVPYEDNDYCIYPIDVYGTSSVDCDEVCLNDSDGDYVCDEDEIAGCVVPGACNFVAGVTDLIPCQWPDDGYDCDGNCVTDTDGDGVCDEFEIVDCTDATACNYNADSTTETDNSLCMYPDAGYDCDGNCLNDSDEDGVCDEFEVDGCTDATACNFEGGATDEDGSCSYCCYVGADVSGYSISVETGEVTPDGTTYRLYLEMVNSDDQLSAITGDVLHPTYIRTTSSFYQDAAFMSPFPTDFNPMFFSLFPELAWDSWVTMGVELAPDSEAGEGAINVVSSTGWEASFYAGNDIEMDGFSGDGWFVTSNYVNGVAGDDNRVLLAQLTTTGVLSGQLFAQIFVNGNQSNSLEISMPFGYNSTDDEAPVFASVPADVTIECSDDMPSEMAVAEDSGCDIPVTVSYSDETEAGDCASGVVTTRTFTATDGFGNETSASQVITQIDTTAPTVVAQDDMTVECSIDLTPGAGTAEEPSGSYDNCSDDLTWSYVDTGLAAFADLMGSTVDIHVELGNDLPGLFGQPLVLDVTGVTVGDGPEMTMDDLTSNPVGHRGGFIIDIDSNGILLTVNGTVTANTTGYQYDYAHVTISNMSSDAIGGVSTVSNGIAADAALSTSFTSNSISLNWDGTSLYDEDSSASFLVDDQSSCLGEGVSRTWTVTDDCGNSSSAVQLFTLVDTEGPTFVDVPADATISCSDEQNFAMAAASDCSGTADVVLSEETTAGSCPGNYTITRTFTATDACGNSTTAAQVVTVEDTVAPTFTMVPEDATYTVADEVPDTMAEASDDCGTVSVEFYDTSDASAGTYTTVTRTFVATDECGNSSEATQTIQVDEIMGCMDAVACNYNESVTFDDGSCDWCSCENAAGGEAGFNLQVETYIENSLPGQTTYRIYVTTPGTEDFISAVTGDAVVPAFLHTTTSFYQDMFGSVNASDINPLFFGLFPDLAYDSWLTIGIESAPTGDQSTVQMVVAGGDTWDDDFEAGGNLDINSFFGGSWFALNTASNGYAGDDQRVLVAQLTTDGEIEGQLYVQVFPNGDSSQDTYLTLSFGASGCGCQDESACNFDASAVYPDDAACVYPDDLYGASNVDCLGNCLADTDTDGVCDEDEVAGCTDSSACNYDDDATDEDGSCDYPETCSGCTDAEACNFNANASEEDGSCTYAEFGLDCDGNCLDNNNDLICDALQGCADAAACNYDADAEQPSYDFCDYCDCPNVMSSHEGYGVEVENYMELTEQGMHIYRLYFTTPTASDRVNAVLGNDENPIRINSSSDYFQHMLGSHEPSDAALFGVVPFIEYDSWITIGENNALSYPAGALGSWIYEFETGGSIEIDDAIGSGWYVNPEDEAGDMGVAGDDQRVLLGQFTTPGSLDGELYVQVFPEGNAAGNTIYVTVSFGDTSCGCTDEDACNFDADALSDDGSCYYLTTEDTCDEYCLFDSESPEIQSVEDYTVDCDMVEEDIREPIATDNCDLSLEMQYADEIVLGACTNSYTILRTWTVTDNYGYYDTAVQEVTVVDETAPTFTVPLSLSIACGEDASDLALTGDVTDATDNCGDVTVSYEDAEGTSNCFAGDVIERSWTAEDECGNTTTHVQVISILDEVIPYFTSVPADMDLECGDEMPTEAAVAADDCSGVSVSVEVDFGEATCTGAQTIYRNFTATDGCGNTATVTQTLTFVDTTAPTFTAPADVTIECGSSDDPSATGGVEDASDNCISDVEITWSDAMETSEDGCFGNDVIRRTWTATDGCGNATSSDQVITLEDTTSPSMDAVAELVELTCGEALPTDLPGATDGCSDVSVAFEDVAGAANCTGMAVITRTYTATDACGNATSSTQLIARIDNTAPTFTIPADLTLECGTDLSDLSIAGDASNQADDCAADMTTSYMDSYSTSEGSCLMDNVVSRTWTVADGCGNSTSATQTITLEDTTPPMVTYEADTVIPYFNGEELPEVWALEVEQECSGYTIETVDELTWTNGFGFDLNRVYTITDDCGNSVIVEQFIDVQFATGCTYPDADNYDPLALADDGSCLYAGCTDPMAANYNPMASIDDESCLIVGCMDPEGLDYNPTANYPGGCDYPDPCPGDLNMDGEVSVGDLLEFFQYFGTICDE